MLNKVLVLLTIFRIWNKPFPKREGGGSAEEEYDSRPFQGRKDKVFELRAGNAGVVHLEKIRGRDGDCGR